MRITETLPDGREVTHVGGEYARGTKARREVILRFVHETKSVLSSKNTIISILLTGGPSGYKLTELGRSAGNGALMMPIDDRLGDWYKNNTHDPKTGLKKKYSDKAHLLQFS